MYSKLAKFISIFKKGVEELNPIFIELANQHHLVSNEFEHKITKDNYKYFLYESHIHTGTTISSENNEETFQLISIHLSFPEQITSENPCLNTHVTMHLLNHKGEEIEVHVFYGENDNLTLPQKIQFTNLATQNVTPQNKKKKSSEATLAPYLVSAFVELANEHYAKVKTLRSAIETYTNKLAENVKLDISALENLCSQNDKNAKSQMLDRLNAMLPQLNHLATLHPDPQYNGLLKIFTRQYKMRNENLQTFSENQNNAELEILPSKKLGEKEANASSSPSQKKNKNKSKQKNKSITTKNKPVKDLPSHINEADAAYLAFKKLQAEIKHTKNQAGMNPLQIDQFDINHMNHLINLAYNDKLLKAYFQFSHKTSDADLLILDTAQISIDDLNKIDSLSRAKFQEGILLLEKLLKDNEFELANQLLIQYLPCIHKDMARYAIMEGNVDLLKYIMKNCPFEINTTTVIDNLTPIEYCYTHHTSSKPLINMFKFLLEQGAQLTRSMEPDGLCIANLILMNTTHPLRRALPNALLRDKFFIEWLYSDVKKYIEKNENKLDAKTNLRLYTMLLDYILRKKEPTLSKTTSENICLPCISLSDAICKKSPFMDKFVKHHIQARIELNKPSKVSGIPPLIAAIQQENKEAFLYLISEFKKINEENKINKDQNKPLIENININLLCEHGYTPLVHAIRKGNPFFVKILLQSGVDPDLPCKSGHSPLFYCIATHAPDLLQMLIDAKANIYGSCKNSLPAFLYAVKMGDINSIRILLKAGVDPNQRYGDEQDSALHLLISSKEAPYNQSRLDIINVLIEANANILLINNESLNSLHLAIQHGYLDIFSYLLMEVSGNNPDKALQIIKEHDLLHFATIINAPTLIDYLLKFCDINMPSCAGSTALLLAVSEQPEIINFLLERKANPNIAAKIYQVTPLHLAVESGNLDLVKLLVQHGADINLTDQDKAKPIHYAQKFNHPHIYEFLYGKHLLSNKNTFFQPSSSKLADENNENKNTTELGLN